MGVWAVIVAGCAFLMARPDVGDDLGRTSLEMMGLAPAPPPMWLPLARPAGLAVPDLAAPGVGADEAAAALLAGQLGHACAIEGLQLRVHLGPNGLDGVEALGSTPACAAATVWAAPWPAMPAPVVVELTVAGN